MQAFARLLDALSFQPARNAKLRLIETYLRQTPDPDRGWGLAALTGGLDFPAAKPALLRSFGEETLGQELFALSYDYVGDLAETLALIWEGKPESGPHRSTLDEPGKVRDRWTAPIVEPELEHAEVRLERGEGVVTDLRLSRGKRCEQRRLSSVR